MNFLDYAKKNPFQVWGSLASVILFAYGFVRHSSQDERAEEFERLNRDANRVTTNAVNSTGLREQLAAVKAANQAVANRTAVSTDLAGNSQYFYRLEAETGVKELSLAQGPNRDSFPKGSYYTTVSFNITVQGKYSQILSFIQKLEGAAWFGRLNTLSIRQASEDRQNNEPVLNAVCSVELLAKRS